MSKIKGPKMTEAQKAMVLGDSLAAKERIRLRSEATARQAKGKETAQELQLRCLEMATERRQAAINKLQEQLFQMCHAQSARVAELKRQRAIALIRRVS